MATNQQPQDPGNEKQGNQSGNADTQNGSQQDAGFENPQRGDEWSNYQTKELAANEGQRGESAEEAAKVFENDENA